MARLALSIAGGVIGAFFGAPEIGFAIGGLLGAVLFPPKLPTNYGPRINDKQVTSSAEGEPIPFGYAGFRLGGNIIWAKPIKETTTKQSQSAKGGPSQSSVSYTYTADFAIAFCEGPGQILRIWADSKLIYDVTGKTAVSLDTGLSNNGTAVTVSFSPTLYSGSETQLPDPVIQADKGVGNTPAFRGMVYAVFHNFPLADFGNRIPNIRAEISSGNVLAFVKDTFPIISTPDPLHGGTVFEAGSVFVDSMNRLGFSLSQTGVVMQRFDINADVSEPAPAWSANTTYELGQQIVDSNGNIQYVGGFTGTPHTSGATQPTWSVIQSGVTPDHHINWVMVGIGPNAVPVLSEGVINPSVSPWTILTSFTAELFGAGVDTAGNFWVTALMTKTDLSETSWGALRLNPNTGLATGFIPLNAPVECYQFRRIGSTDLVFATTASNFVDSTRFYVFDAKTLHIKTNIVYDRTASVGSFDYHVSPMLATDPNTGVTYFPQFNYDGTKYNWRIITFDPRGVGTVTYSAAFHGPHDDTSDGYPTGLLLDTADNTLILFFNNSANSYTIIKKYDLSTRAIVATTSVTGIAFQANNSEMSGFAYGGLVPQDGIIRVMSGDSKSILYYNSSDLSIDQSVFLSDFFPAIGPGGTMTLTSYAYDALSNSALMILSNGTTYNGPVYRVYFDRKSVQAESIGSIVQDILERGGLSSGQIDTTAIDSTLCLGYAIARMTDGKQCLTPLCQAFFFDLIESDFKIKAVPRGQTATQNIPEADLGLLGDKYKLAETIAQEQDLPKTVSVEYMDPALNYQQAKQQKYRSSRVKKTKNQAVIQLPISMNADSAVQISEKYLSTVWAERNQYDLKLWKSKYLVVDPADVVQFTYEGLPFQARVVKHSNGQNRVLEITGVSENAAQYLSTLTGNPTQGFNPGTILSAGPTLLFLMDLPYLQDIDADTSGNTGYYYAMGAPVALAWPGGTLYDSPDAVAFTQISSTFTDIIYGTVSNTTPAPASADVWDLTTVINVKLADRTQTLSSDTRLNVLNGANAFLLGQEILQFTNATLQSDGSYNIDTLLRGRRGTEWAASLHGPGETFIQLTSGGIQRISASTAIVGLLRTYKGVTLGNLVSNTQPTQMTLAANDLKPYSVANLKGTRY